MIPSRNLRRLALIAALSLSALAACDESTALSRAGEERLRKGEFDTAIEIYQAAYEARPDNPEALAGLGELLTLRRISLFAGLDLMHRSLQLEADPALRERVALIYAGMQRFDLARALIDPAQMSVQELYSEPVQLLRAGLDCLESPGQGSINRLMARPRSPRRDYFVALCEAKRASPEKKEPAVKALLAITDAETLCEAVAVWPPELDPSVGFLRRALSECQRRFRGNLALFRERLPHAAAQPATTGRTLYGRSVFETADPGAERSAPDYRYGNQPVPYEIPDDGQAAASDAP